MITYIQTQFHNATLRAPKMKKAILEDVASEKETLSNVKARVAGALGQKAGEAVLEPLTGASRRE